MGAVKWAAPIGGLLAALLSYVGLIYAYRIGRKVFGLVVWGDREYRVFG